MQKTDVIAVLNRVRDARAKFDVARAKFNADATLVTRRLIYEAAVHYMSAEDIAAAVGATPKQVRLLMRNEGLDPRRGVRLLSKHASQTLNNNAALLGVDPREMDLMSPLAYLPMGNDLKTALSDAARVGVAELPGVSGNLVDRIVGLIHCEWCGRAGVPCVEWEEPIETYHEQRVAAAQAVVDALQADNL